MDAKKKAERKKLRPIKALVIRAIRNCLVKDSWDNRTIMGLIRDDLLLKHPGYYEDVSRFLAWGFSRGGVQFHDFYQRWEEWRASLAGRVPYKGKDAKKLIKIGRAIMKTMQESYLLTQKLKADLDEFVKETGITRGQLKRGY